MLSMLSILTGIIVVILRTIGNGIDSIDSYRRLYRSLWPKVSMARGAIDDIYAIVDSYRYHRHYRR